jgi:hypothetical protein
MSRGNLLILSVFGGIVIAFALTALAFSVDNRTISGLLLWQHTLLFYLIGPRLPVGHYAHGNQMYEGTPIHLLIFPLGLLLTIPLYSVLSYFFLKWCFRHH